VRLLVTAYKYYYIKTNVETYILTKLNRFPLEIA